ncbi:MAG: hypothetical protein M3Y69_05860 [Verrucomicrobiota bacterium]|nr:hypothetical protein [Verrucomicrobiota bacterium]
MQSEDAAGPIEWDVAELKRSIEEWEEIASHILALLQSTTESAASAQNWQPHAAQITAVVRRFRDLCRRQSSQLGRWREDGLTADQAYDRVWDKGDQLVRWLTRMMQA